MPILLLLPSNLISPDVISWEKLRNPFVILSAIFWKLYPKLGALSAWKLALLILFLRLVYLLIEQKYYTSAYKKNSISTKYNISKT